MVVHLYHEPQVMDLTMRVIESSGLCILMFGGAHNNGKGRYLSEPAIIKNSLLEQMVEPEELQSLLLVKIDNRNPDAKHLRTRKFADGIHRRLALVLATATTLQMTICVWLSLLRNDKYRQLVETPKLTTAQRGAGAPQEWRGKERFWS
ncbi:hypothetical protein [Leptothermofonsia sp. ETS-13]|uniref:hypothetical protein n=1 Tax=Leptothermofonsia sp. ETS-13 TaxID=3035696 RepID=UPI003B9F04F5